MVDSKSSDLGGRFLTVHHRPQSIAIGVTRRGEVSHLVTTDPSHPIGALDSLVPQWRDDIDGVVVDCGPGAYTSLRNALATALGMGAALNVPVRGVLTTVAMAHTECRLHRDVTTFDVVIPMGKRGAAKQSFHCDGALVEPFGDIHIVELRPDAVPSTRLEDIMPCDFVSAVAAGQALDPPQVMYAGGQPWQHWKAADG